jgi:aspartyl-tRNA(Asn)/glutamyl-tRNA(Gln) amidotransferase subunit C
MSININDVHKIARLARLAITEQEAQAAKSQLATIFSLIAQMQAIDTTDIQPMSHAQDATQRLREDRVSETDQRALFQTLAPQVELNFYLVPPAIE